MAERIVLVRHGETEWSRDRRHTGRTDIPLTDNGRAQAQRLRNLLQGYRFDAVFTSPLQRARDTCTLAGFGGQAVVDPDLQEWDYGRYDGLTLQEIQQQQPGWLLWRDGPGGGETMEAIVQRVDRVIARCAPVRGTVALFAHGHVLRVLTARWLDLPGQAGQRFVLDPASPCVLGYEHEWTALRSWNTAPE